MISKGVIDGRGYARPEGETGDVIIDSNGDKLITKSGFNIGFKLAGGGGGGVSVDLSIINSPLYFEPDPPSVTYDTLNSEWRVDNPGDRSFIFASFSPWTLSTVGRYQTLRVGYEHRVDLTSPLPYESNIEVSTDQAEYGYSNLINIDTSGQSGVFDISLAGFSPNESIISLRVSNSLYITELGLVDLVP